METTFSVGDMPTMVKRWASSSQKLNSPHHPKIGPLYRVQIPYRHRCGIRVTLNKLIRTLNNIHASTRPRRSGRGNLRGLSNRLSEYTVFNVARIPSSILEEY